MFDILADTDPALAAAAVLASATAERAAADQAEARLLMTACDWADLHPPESIHLAATFDRTPGGSEHEERIAGRGCPLVAEFSVAEFAAALGTSTTAGKRLIGHALELRHRLPRVWRRIHAGEVPTWRARRIAEATIHADLHPAAAAYVDRMVAPFVERIGTAALDRLVAEALLRSAQTTPALHPDDPDAAAASATDQRHATIHDQDIAFDGTVRVEAVLGIADAADLDHALTSRAAAFRDLGSDESLDVRRSRALGDLARTQTSLDLSPGQPDLTDADADATTNVPTARELVLHVHLGATTTEDGEAHLDPVATLERHQQQLLLDQVRGWCRDSLTRITLRPVLDLATQLHTRSYTPTPTQREQVVQRDRTCVFPWCHRPARGCQIDHVTPYDPDDPNTTSDNLAALCTFHHRLKTHGSWSYTVIAPGEYLWRSPHGHHYLRDHTGTRPLDRHRPSP